jgi:hypothetical protein
MAEACQLHAVVSRQQKCRSGRTAAGQHKPSTSACRIADQGPCAVNALVLLETDEFHVTVVHGGVEDHPDRITGSVPPDRFCRSKAKPKRPEVKVRMAGVDRSGCKESVAVPWLKSIRPVIAWARGWFGRFQVESRSSRASQVPVIARRPVKLPAGRSVPRRRTSAGIRINTPKGWIQAVG